MNKTIDLIFISLFLAGCPSPNTTTPDYTTSTPKDTEATNRIRAKSNIRTIDRSWNFVHSQFGEESWMDPAGRLCKVVKRNAADRIIWEFDRYYSDATFMYPDPDSTIPQPECLIVFFVYSSNNFFVTYSGVDPTIKTTVEALKLMPLDPADPYGKDSNGFAHRGETNQATLATADQILLRWGLNRSGK